MVRTLVSEPTQEVVSALVAREGRFLLGQRPGTKDYPFTWETPGGKVEWPESHHQAIRRELREELGLEIGAICEKAVWCGEVEREGRTPIFLLFYTVFDFTGEPTPREGQGFGWFSIDEMASGLRLAPGNSIALPTLRYVFRGQVGNAK